MCRGSYYRVFPFEDPSCGRARKKLEPNRSLEGSPHKPIGRPRKVTREEAASGPHLAGPPSPTIPYFTHAKKIWFMEKIAGLEFSGSDEETCSVLENRMRR